MYTKYFGFSKRPFTDSAIQAALNLPSYETAYTSLRQNLAERRGLLLLTGVTGIGKTTLLHQLMADLQDQACCILFWNAYVSFDDVLDCLCTEFELSVPGTGRAQKVQALVTYLITRLPKDEITLVLDDAQNLSDETLEELHQLVRLETAGRPLLQVVLSGQPLLVSRLAKTPALQALGLAVGGHCQLSPLTDDEAVLYIKKRLQAAGHSGEGLFETDALQKIITYAKGVPRLINLICNQTLLMAYLNSEQRVSASSVRKIGIRDQQLDLPPIGTFPMALQQSPPRNRPTIQPIPPCVSSSPVSGAIAHLPCHPRRQGWLTLALLLLVAVAPGVAAVHYFNLSWDPLPWLLNSFSQREASAGPNASLLVKKPSQDMTIVALTLPPAEDTRLAAMEALLPAPSSVSPAQDPDNPSFQSSSEAIPDLAKTKHIQALLDQAERRITALHYTRPAGKSALDNYRKVLELDPQNNHALRGIRLIKSHFVQWADSARTRGDLAKAQGYLATALAIDPGDTAVQRRLDRIREEQIVKANRSSVSTYAGKSPWKGSLSPSKGSRSPRQGWINRD